jgi:hypothetical protein
MSKLSANRRGLLSVLLILQLLIISGLTLAANPQFDKETFHIYVFIGQSNMAGRGDVEAQDRASIPGAYLFNSQGAWEIATAPMNRYTNSELGSRAKLNPAYTFAKAMTQAYPHITFGIISNARGGTTIEQWQKDYTGAVSGNDNDGRPWTGVDQKNLYTRTLERIKEAQQYGTVKGILWHQGEGNRSDVGYVNKLAKLISDLRADLGDPDLVFVAGEVYNGPGAYSNSGGFNMRLAALPNQVPNTAVITAAGTSVWDTTTHFDSASQRILGYRYADKIKLLVYGATVDITAPSTPQGIYIVDKSMSHVTMAWEPSTDDQGVAGYEIYLNSNSTPSFITTAPTCTLSGLAPGALVLANVVAFDTAGNRSPQSAMFVGSAERFKP